MKHKDIFKYKRQNLEKKLKIALKSTKDIWQILKCPLCEILDTNELNYFMYSPFKCDCWNTKIFYTKKVQKRNIEEISIDDLPF